MKAEERRMLLTPAALRKIDELNKKRPKVLTLVSDEERLRANASVPPNMVPNRVWLSRYYMVQEYIRADTPIRLSISRTKMKRNGHFEDGLTWDELQAIKAEIGYGDQWAVEIFPPDADLVHDANFRHLWIVLKPTFAWTKENRHDQY